MNILRQSTPFVVISAVVLAVLGLVRGFVSPTSAEMLGASDMPLAVWLEGARDVGMGLYVPLVLLAVLFCMINTLSASLYSVDVGGRTTLPLQVWCVAGCCAVFPEQTLSSFVAAWLMTVVLKNVAKSYKRSYSFGAVFMASFAVGVLPLIYAPFVVLYGVLPVVWLLAKRTSREMMVGMVGGALPMLGAAYVYWACGGEFGYVFRLLYDEAVGYGYFGMIPFAVPQIVLLAMLLAVAVTFAVAMANSSGGMRSKARVTGYIHILMLVALAGSLLLGGSTLMLVPASAVAVALLSPKAFGRGFATLSSSVYMLLMLGVVSCHIWLMLLH